MNFTGLPANPRELTRKNKLDFDSIRVYWRDLRAAIAPLENKSPKAFGADFSVPRCRWERKFAPRGGGAIGFGIVFGEADPPSPLRLYKLE